MKGLALGLLAVAVVVVSLRWGSFVAGGSDSYCYAHQAERWAAAIAAVFSGRRPVLQPADPLALAAPWPDATWAFAPAGHLPSPTVPGAIVPVCPSGLSIVMAPFVLAGGRAAMFLPFPLFGALFVVATYAVGARFGARVGMAAALMAAASPPFLYQVVQPMSDVPAAALWLLAVAGATGTKPKHLLGGGVAAGLAILMRPNLAPLAVPIGVFLLLRPERSWRQRFDAAVRFAAGAVPGCLAVAAIQTAFYGSPVASGYGSLALLFRAEHVGPNVERYFPWLWQTHTPALALALAAPFLLPGAFTALLLALAAVNLALYLPYVVFEDWSFVRFLLPTIPLLLILVVATADTILRRVGVRRTSLALTAMAALLAVLFVREARDRQTFRLQRLEARFEVAGRYVGERLPPNALVITSWQSGSVRFYGRRPTLAWDGLPADRLPEAIAFARARGLEPFLLFERREEADFRQRFGGGDVAALDWPPAAEVAGARIFRPGDRERYLRGEGVRTVYAK
jgi:hypothetical protein